MKQLISKYKFQIFIILVSALYVIIKSILNSTSNGYKENYEDYFSDPALIVPAILIILSRHPYTTNLCVAVIYIVLLMTATELFWSYMDKPWFSPPETNTCDGPCYGWFSFENYAPTFFLLLYGIISIAFGSILVLAKYSLKNAISYYRNHKMHGKN